MVIDIARDDAGVLLNNLRSQLSGMKAPRRASMQNHVQDQRAVLERVIAALEAARPDLA